MKILKCILDIILKNLGSIIIATSILIAALIYVNFNPYEVCKRDLGYREGLRAPYICSGLR